MKTTPNKMLELFSMDDESRKILEEQVKLGIDQVYDITFIPDNPGVPGTLYSISVRKSKGRVS